MQEWCVENELNKSQTSFYVLIKHRNNHQSLILKTDNRLMQLLHHRVFSKSCERCMTGSILFWEKHHHFFPWMINHKTMCLPVQSPPHVRQRRSKQASCACIVMRVQTQRIPRWRVHLRKNLVHRVKGQTLKQAGERLCSDAAASSSSSSSSSLPASNNASFLPLSCSFPVGCEVQWAPFPQFIRANVMSEDQPPPPSSPLFISSPFYPPTNTATSIHSLLHLIPLPSLCHRFIRRHFTRRQVVYVTVWEV